MAEESQRRTAKRLIRIAKKNPGTYSKEDVLYAKMYRKFVKKKKNDDS